MKFLNTDLHTLTAALTFGALSIGLAPAAMAASSYDATAELTFTLTDVTGNQIASDWSVSALGDYTACCFANDSGAATAAFDFNVIDPAVSLSIGDAVTQTSNSSGSASNGFADSAAFTELDITITNDSSQALTFSFSYDAILSGLTTVTAPGDVASAEAAVFMEDNNTIYADAASTFGNGEIMLFGEFDLALDPTEMMVISIGVDSEGFAEAVPVPAAVWLFGSGLLGLVGIARRRKAA